jgi:hypothetical protein
MSNQSLRGYSRQQTLTATARSCLEPGALNVAEQPLQPEADELETDLLTNATPGISMVVHTAIEHLP